MSAVAITTDGEGVYERRGKPTRRLYRYTVFVFYPDDPAAGALDLDALGGVPGSTEEIDVNATSLDDAETIAKAAVDRDYEPGGRIVHVEERVGWYV